MLGNRDNGHAVDELLVGRVQTDGDEAVVADVHMFIACRHVAETFDEQAADRVRFHIAKVFIQSFFDKPPSGQAVDDAGTFRAQFDFVRVFSGGGEAADDFVQNGIDRENAERSAIFADDDADAVRLAFHLFQDLGNLESRWDEINGIDGQILRGVAAFKLLAEVRQRLVGIRMVDPFRIVCEDGDAPYVI